MFDFPHNASISILIADDHQLVRDMIGAFIDAQPDFDITAVSSYPEALEALSANKAFDVVLLDVKMPGMDGISSLGALVRKFPETAIVVFSGSTTDEYVKDALEQGARGYIPKTLPFKSLLNTIRLIASGEVFIPSSFLNSTAEAGGAMNFGLSQNELKVLRKVCAGQSNKEIARDLQMTEVTVKMHMRGICNKMGAKNRTQAAVIALREQIA
ncbi:response regulator transcription factor [Roseovarius sp. LXJ103]|uniref:response regulator n=1 Tax=Roseovarius carneus TaxID=2853164 RepID=UPI0015E81583|nr:response regulator transcription factor [Roseovarius carneus]MBZ8117739.1 response regulator transcription factor [Roseovarius carneus]